MFPGAALVPNAFLPTCAVCGRDGGIAVAPAAHEIDEDDNFFWQRHDHEPEGKEVCRFR